MLSLKLTAPPLFVPQFAIIEAKINGSHYRPFVIHKRAHNMKHIANSSAEVAYNLILSMKLLWYWNLHIVLEKFHSNIYQVNPGLFIPRFAKYNFPHERQFSSILSSDRNLSEDISHTISICIATCFSNQLACRCVATLQQLLPVWTIFPGVRFINMV